MDNPNPPSVPRSLARLAGQPAKLSWPALWRAMPEKDRHSAAAFGLERGAESLRDYLAGQVAERRSFRKRTVDAWDDAKLAAAAARVRSLKPDAIADLLMGLHHQGRRSMMATYVDELGLPHDNGRIAPDAALPETTAAQRGQAAARLIERFPTADALVYFFMLSLRGDPHAPPLDVVARLVAASAEPDGAGGGAEIETAAGEGVEDEKHSDVDGFTTLDVLMLLATVETAQNTEGALTEDQLDDLVGEVIELNRARHQSFFHAGFLEALFDRPVREKLPATNEPRQAWYWAGRIQGLAREGRWEEIVDLYDTVDLIRKLGSRDGGSSHAATRHVAQALFNADRPGDVASFVRLPIMMRDPGLVPLLHAEASRLLETIGPVPAKPLFDLLGDAVLEAEQRGVDTSVEPYLTIRRRQAHSHRRLGEFGKSREILDALLEDDPDINTRAMVLSDLGIMEAGYKGVTDVRLPPRRDEIPTVLAALERGEEKFAQALALEARYSAHARYCLGIIAFLRQNYSAAADRLESSLAEFQSHPARYDRNEFLETVRLYLGLALCLDCQEDRLKQAIEWIETASAGGAEIPLYLVENTVSVLGAAASQYGRRAAEAIIAAAGESAIDPLVKAGVDTPALARVILGRAAAGDVGQHERAAAWRSALPMLLRHRMIEDAERVLDDLSQLARGGVAREEFLAILERPEGYEPAWTPDDALWERTRCLEAAGAYVDAARLLIPNIHSVLTEERYGAESDARAMVEHVRSYGSAGGLDAIRRELEAVEERIDAVQHGHDDADADADAGAEAGAMPGKLSGRPVRILFVGGDERQKKHQEWIVEQLAERDPGITVTFLHPGWSGNWAPHLETAKRALATADGVVVMKFIRTIFGRQLRREIQVPWRGCHGAGRTAMLNSVLVTAREVRG
ncbi:MAG: hypothetical protein ACR2GQ_01210 [Gemmatimonadota bacterium]